MVNKLYAPMMASRQMVAGHTGVTRTADAVAFHSADLLAQPHFVRFYSRDQFRRRDPTATLGHSFSNRYKAR